LRKREHASAPMKQQIAHLLRPVGFGEQSLLGQERPVVKKLHATHEVQTSVTVSRTSRHAFASGDRPV
jgi:hypothetical protein